MNKEQIVRAWKDEEYRRSLSAEELAALPQNPAGLVELSEGEMGEVGGLTVGACNPTVQLVTVVYWLCPYSMTCTQWLLPSEEG